MESMPEEEKLPHVCLDMVLPPAMQVEAAERAVEENPSNLPIFRHRPGMGVAPSPLQLALVTGKKWQNGRTLHVRFLDGQAQIQAKVKQFAVQWCQFANIKLEFDNSADAEIRIAFQRDGSWSYIGTDNLVIPKNQATMNFGWFTTSTPDEEYERTVVHEFGHALQDAICPDFGQSLEAAAMGEGFGDYFAGSFFAAKKVDAGHGHLVPALMTWDGIQFDASQPPPCVRRLDGRLTYESFNHKPTADEHDNGEIWSATLWDIWQTVGRDTADRIVVESHFQLDGFTTFARGARSILDADRNLFNGRHVTRLKKVFHKRGIGPVE